MNQKQVLIDVFLALVVGFNVLIYTHSLNAGWAATIVCLKVFLALSELEGKKP